MPLVLHKMSQLDYCSSIAKTSRAIVPIGSLEQHGPHLPVSTDSIIIEYIATESIKKIPSFILPVIPYGVSYEHGPLFNVSIRNLSYLICFMMYVYPLSRWVSRTLYY